MFSGIPRFHFLAFILTNSKVFWRIPKNLFYKKVLWLQWPSSLSPGHGCGQKSQTAQVFPQPIPRRSQGFLGLSKFSTVDIQRTAFSRRTASLFGPPGGPTRRCRFLGKSAPKSRISGTASPTVYPCFFCALFEPLPGSMNKKHSDCGLVWKNKGISTGYAQA